MIAVDDLGGWKLAIPSYRRKDGAEIFRRASAHVEVSEILGNLPETLPELAVSVAAGKYNHARDITSQMKWVLPAWRDFLGLDPRELAVWERTTSVRGRSMILRALAHALEFDDI